MQQETLHDRAKLKAMNTHKLWIAAVLSICSSSVLAQWQWIDEAGRKVFSDRPPPAHIAPEQILKQPHGARSSSPRVVYPSAETAALPPKSAQPSQPVQPIQTEAEATPTAQTPEAAAQAKQAAEDEAKQKALEAAKRKAEEAEEKKQKAQQAQARQENCQRARSAQATLQSGSLLGTVNAKGERGFMTEEQRKTDLQRAQQAIKSNCS
ncbi:MAG: DUF4124 domain-containing protein [Comamonas sp.]